MNRFATLTSLVLAALLVPAASVHAQSKALEGIRAEWANIKTQVVTAATKAPDSIYDFKPTPEVFTLRKMVLHIADASYSICSGFKGTPGKRPKVDADDATMPKAAVLTTLNAAFAYCDGALAEATDATLAEEITAASGSKRMKSTIVSHLLAHTSLHYGNVVTYMRLNKMSPGTDQ